jgi:cadmium resistance protein CadD (predicted permease)
VIDWWSSLGLALALFVASHVDDLLIVPAMFLHPGMRPGQVFVGQLLGMAILIGLTLAGASFAVAIAPQHVALLGVVPLLIGLWQGAVQLRRRGRAADEGEEAPKIGRAGAVIAVAMIALASGGDNLALYVPVFATRGGAERTLFASAFMVLTAAWCGLAYAVVRHPRWGESLRRYLVPLAPLVLIVLGIVVLLDAC